MIRRTVLVITLTNKRHITLLHQSIADLLNKTSVICVALDQLRQQNEIEVLCITEIFVKQGSRSNIVLNIYKLVDCIVF